MNCECTKPLACVQVNRCLKDYVEATPQNWDDLCNRQAVNYETSGMGMDTMVHLPCFGCGAKNFLIHRLLDCHAAYNTGSTCKECGRGFRMPVTRKASKCEHGHEHVDLGFEVVQTVGPDLPDWFKIPVRRDMRGN